MKETLCVKRDASYRLACINRQCQDCGVSKLKLMLQEVDMSQTPDEVKWEWSEYVPIAIDGKEKKRLNIVTMISKSEEMFVHFNPFRSNSQDTSFEQISYWSR